ncbi:putative leader peptide [Streptomyces sp. NPDC008313]|uniref:putative leader peptide n=1 Tax=Streptomyces sp. NPDC008313 TaxID=3364826 RepID=UPI0036E08426
MDQSVRRPRPCDGSVGETVRPARWSGLRDGQVELTPWNRRGSLRIVTDTCVRLWRRVHMDLVRYAGCVCRPSR